MWLPAAREALYESLNLIVYLRITAGQRIVTAHPFLLQHLPELEQAAHAMWEEGIPQRRMLSSGGSERFLVYVLPAGERNGVLLVFDLSPIEWFLQRFHLTVADVYRDVFYSATEGRLLLVRHKDIPDLIGERVQEWVQPIEAPEDIAACRKLVERCLAEVWSDRKKILEFQLCVSEGATNALKHAGGGEFRLIQSATGWCGLICDHGPGIDASLLPQSALLKGFSTKPSLGLGFKAMLRCLDRLVVASSSQGVTLLLQRFDSGCVSSGGGSA